MDEQIEIGPVSDENERSEGEESLEKKSTGNAIAVQTNTFHFPVKKFNKIIRSERELKFLVNQLDNLIEYIRNDEDIKIMYKCTRELEKKLENDVSELSFLMKEIKAVLVHIKQLRNQRAKVRKETKVTRKYLHKQKRQEIHEMELVVAVYDKDLLRKWQVAKKSSQQATIESFLNDALGKKEAVSYICRMAGERLQTLRNIERERRSTKILQSLFTNQTTTNQGTSNEIVAADDYSLF